MTDPSTAAYFSAIAKIRAAVAKRKGVVLTEDEVLAIADYCAATGIEEIPIDTGILQRLKADAQQIKARREGSGT